MMLPALLPTNTRTKIMSKIKIKTKANFKSTTETTSAARAAAANSPQKRLSKFQADVRLASPENTHASPQIGRTARPSDMRAAPSQNHPRTPLTSPHGIRTSSFNTSSYMRVYAPSPALWQRTPLPFSFSLKTSLDESSALRKWLLSPAGDTAPRAWRCTSQLLADSLRTPASAFGVSTASLGLFAALMNLSLQAFQ